MSSHTPLTTMAEKIYAELDVGRGTDATTIAVVKCTDGLCYCTANDVEVFSKAALNKAKSLKIATIGEQQISNAGGGYHAEMWMIIQAIVIDSDIAKDPIKNLKSMLVEVGASRACCKYCTAILNLCGIAMECPSEDVYKSWMNPLTLNEANQPRKGFTEWQRSHIPDFRQNSTNYWYKADGETFVKSWDELQTDL